MTIIEFINEHPGWRPAWWPTNGDCCLLDDIQWLTFRATQADILREPALGLLEGPKLILDEEERIAVLGTVAPHHVDGLTTKGSEVTDVAAAAQFIVKPNGPSVREVEDFLNRFHGYAYKGLFFFSALGPEDPRFEQALSHDLHVIAEWDSIGEGTTIALWVALPQGEDMVEVEREASLSERKHAFLHGRAVDLAINAAHLIIGEAAATADVEVGKPS